MEGNQDFYEALQNANSKESFKHAADIGIQLLMSNLRLNLFGTFSVSNLTYEIVNALEKSLEYHEYLYELLSEPSKGEVPFSMANFIRIAANYFFKTERNPEKALLLYDCAIKVGQKEKNTMPLLSFIISDKASFLITESRYEEALECSNTALELYEHFDQQVKSHLSIMLVVRGHAKKELTRYADAKADYKAAFDLLNLKDFSSREREALINIICNLGTLQIELGEYDNAMENYVKASQLSQNEEIPRERRLRINRLIAYCYTYMGNYKKAAEMFEIMPDFQDEILTFKDKAVLLHNYGKLLIFQERYDLAMEKLVEAKKLVQDCIEIVPIWHSIAEILCKTSKFDEALKEIENVRKINTPNFKYKVNTDLIYGIILSCEEKSSQKGVEIIQDVIKTAESCYGQESAAMAKFHKELGDVYFRLENFPQALESYQKALNVIYPKHVNRRLLLEKICILEF